MLSSLFLAKSYPRSFEPRIMRPRIMLFVDIVANIADPVLKSQHFLLTTTCLSLYHSGMVYDSLLEVVAKTLGFWGFYFAYAPARIEP